MTKREFSDYVYESMIRDELERIKELLSFYELEDEDSEETLYNFARENVRNNIKEILAFYEIGREIKN